MIHLVSVTSGRVFLLGKTVLIVRIPGCHEHRTYHWVLCECDQDGRPLKPTQIMDVPIEEHDIPEFRVVQTLQSMGFQRRAFPTF
jgi:hypothetical protein